MADPRTDQQPDRPPTGSPDPLPHGPGSPAPPEIVDAMADGVYVVSQQRSITYWNPAAERITGFAPGDALGRWCGDGLLNHVDEEGRPLCGLRCPLVATMRDGQRRSVHAYLHHREGHVVPVRVTAAPLRAADGTITGAVETFTEDYDLVSVRADLTSAEARALTDALTGIGNRRFFDRDLDRRLALWRRDRQLFALVAADLDGFKAVNDVHGHEVGDRVLQIVAKSLAGAVRGTDTVFRTGGDEFAVLAGPITREDLAALAARLAMVVPASRYGGTPPIRVSLSIGCALVEPNDDARSLRVRADQALYAAKRGRPAVEPALPA